MQFTENAIKFTTHASDFIFTSLSVTRGDITAVYLLFSFEHISSIIYILNFFTAKKIPSVQQYGKKNILHVDPHNSPFVVVCKTLLRELSLFAAIHPWCAHRAGVFYKHSDARPDWTTCQPVPENVTFSILCACIPGISMFSGSRNFRTF